MRTTIDLPDTLFHQAKFAAVKRRVSLKKFITEVLDAALNASPANAQRMQRPPIGLGMVARVPVMSNRALGELLEAEALDKITQP